jgi:hypothetical protein
MNKYLLLAIILFAAISGYFYFSRVLQQEDTQIASASSTVTFPQGGEQLVRGMTYTLAWTGGTDPVQIFLIDLALKNQGTSVSISDRVYGIKNEHIYNYTVPSDMKPGEYEFIIGSATSNPFRIVEN